MPVAELQHRIRNTLALVRSVVRRTAASSETVEDYAMHLDGRLGAIARLQDMSLWGQDGKGIDLAYLLAEELLAHGAREGEQVTLTGPPIELRNRAGALLGLAFHELAVNAVKFGALSGSPGQVAVDWRVEDMAPNATDAGSLWLQWKETLASSTAPAPQRRGFGTELIEGMLAYELGAAARLELLAEGARCTIALPLTADVAPGAPDAKPNSE